jgi:hypothetical protein
MNPAARSSPTSPPSSPPPPHDLEPGPGPPRAPTPRGRPDGITEQDLAALKRFAKVRAFMARHGSKLWWLHSAYALTFGAFVVMYASKGYDNARWMVVLLGLGWLVLVLFFRLFGTGPARRTRSRTPSPRSASTS